MNVSFRRLLRSVCVSGILLVVVFGLVVLTAKAAIYNAFISGTVSWTATSGVWNCSTTTTPGDACAQYPGFTAFTNGIVDSANMTTSGGPGTITVNSAIAHPVTLNISGAGATVDAASGGSLGLTGNSAVTSTGVTNVLSVSGGTLSNAGTLTIGGSGSSFNLNSGTLNGAGTTGIASGNFLSVTATSGAMTINQQTINNSGTANFNSGGTLTMGNSAALNNAGIFNGSLGSTISPGGGSVLFTNSGSGTLQNTGIGLFTLGIPLVNNGVASLPSTGAADVLSGGSGPGGHSGATWNLGVGNSMNFGGTHVFNAGETFQGTGTFTINSGGAWIIGSVAPALSLAVGENLTNNGTIGFGAAYNGVFMTGTFTQSASGSFNPKIGPVGFNDTINNTGPATLSGTLAPILGVGYTPSNGDTFTVVSCNPCSGTFNYTPIPYANGTFQAVYTGTAVQLIATPQADVSITKSGPVSVLDGQNATFTITVTNNGPSPATNIVIADTITGGTFVSASGACVAFPCTIGSLGALASTTITEVVRANGVGTMTNTATISSSTPSDPAPGNNSFTASVTVNPAADLSIPSITASANPVNAGAPETFTINLNNAGPDTAASVSLNLSLTAGTITSASGAGFVCSTSLCTAASLPIGPATVTVSATAPAQAGTMTLNANVNSTTGDPVPGNNTGSSAAVAVNAITDIGVTKTLVGGSLVAGQNATYNIKVFNNGPSDAANVQLTDPTPAGLTLVSVTGGPCVTLPCTIGTLTALSNVIITAVYSVPSSASGTVTNTASVTTSTPDSSSINNSSSVGPTAIAASADLQISKTLSGFIDAGGTATFIITVTNLGPSDAQNVSVSDPAPVGVLFFSNSGACATVFPCSLGTLAAGASASITSSYTVPASASGSVSNTATVSSSTPDANSGNNSATATGTIFQKADVLVTKKGPAAATPGSNVTFTITVTNNGPSIANNVMLDDPTPTRLTFVSATAPCTSGFASPCALAATLNPGQTKSVNVTYTVQPGGSTTTSNQATASSLTPDPNSSNNVGVATLAIGICPTTPTSQQPADGATNQQTSGVLIWSDANATSYNVFLGPAGTGCSTLLGTTKTPALQYNGLLGGTAYEWRIEAVTPGCAVRTSTCIKFTTAGSSCPTTPPTLTAPLNTTVTGQTTFTWSSVPGAKDYQLFVNGNLVTTTTATSFGPTSVSNGPVVWFVVAEFDAPCASLTSASGGYNSCDTSNSKTIPSIVAQSDAGQSYTLFWDAVASATKYEVDEATDVNFTNPTTLSATTTSMSFSHPVTVPTAFFYRVRAFIPCANAFGPNSVSVRIVLSPATAPSNPNVGAPSGSDTLIPIVVHIAGFPDGTFPFTASLDPQQPWLVRVDPSAGLLPPDGINLTVFANPTGLPTGTHTGTVIVLVTTPSSGRLAANGTTPVGAPVSISLVTPVTPKPSGAPPANSLIIVSTGHLDGINSRWASDVRILNTALQTVHYQITFTPDNVSQGVKQTVIETAAGATTALDDVVKTWYGVGSLGESSNGSLEIRPLDNPAKTGSDDAPSISFTTVASSRTYNAAPNSAAGTLGEFIPAILFQNFVGKAIDSTHAATILSLQQIAQNDAMRTNFGVMEASGQPAAVLISVFDSSGKKLLDTPLTLLGGQHAQLNGFLSQNKISLPDGRIQVQVVGGDGKITAYASVIDNKSGDPILISGVPLGQTSADHFVLPGVADLNTGAAAWRTDMRIFNPTSSAQNVQLTFYPVNGMGQPQSTSLGINAGEVKQLDNTLQSVFGLTNIGGAIHVQTTTAQPLVISGRTFNLTSNGTFGQLTTAVTAADAIGKGDRPLQILQTEDSVRLRTNVGMFEVTGKPATVEVTVFLPDSKFAPSTQIPLPANGFVQIPVIQSFGLSNVYNGRVSMRVVDGDGRIGAYGSVIDQVTQAPTYIPAQH